MTSEQHQVSNLWARGADWWPIRKVKSGWIITTDGVWSLVGSPPTVFKTKGAAQDFFSNLCMIRFREWRAAEHTTPPGDR